VSTQQSAKQSSCPRLATIIHRIIDGSAMVPGLKSRLEGSKAKNRELDGTQG
jgi:hypothetical protein